MYDIVNEGMSSVTFQKKNKVALSKLIKHTINTLCNKDRGIDYTIKISDFPNVVFGMDTSSRPGLSVNISGNCKLNFNKLYTICEGNLVYLGLDMRKDWIKIEYPKDSSIMYLVERMLQSLSYEDDLFKSANGKSGKLYEALKSDLTSLGMESDLFFEGVINPNSLSILRRIAWDSSKLARMSNVIKIVNDYVKNNIPKIIMSMEGVAASSVRDDNWFSNLSDKKFLPIITIDTSTNEGWYYTTSYPKSFTSARSGKWSIDNVSQFKNIYFNEQMVSDIRYKLSHF